MSQALLIFGICIGVAALIIGLLTVLLLACRWCREQNFGASYDEEEEEIPEEEEEFERQYKSIKKIRELPALVVEETVSEETNELNAHSRSSSDNDDEHNKGKNDPPGVSFMPTNSFGRISKSTSGVNTKGSQVDVHVCNSSSCEICNKNGKGIQFIEAKPLEQNMIDRLRFIPTQWWEMGVSLFDMSVLPSPRRREAADDDEKSIWSRFSSKGSSKRRKRSTKTVTTDEAV